MKPGYLCPKGYKQTEVGVIPVDWEVHQLGGLLQGSRSVRYGVVQPGKFEPSGCFMLRSQDYSKGWAGPEGMHKISPQLENQYKNARIRRDDLVMTVVGAGIGQVVVVPDWVDGTILSRSTARIAIDEDKAASRFVKAFLEGPIGKRQILECQKEGAQPVVSCPDLAKFFVAHPPLPEQRAIATALSDVVGLLGQLEQLIAKKRDLKQAAMQQLLTGQTRLPGFKGEWVVKTLGEVAFLSKGSQLHNSETDEDGKFAHLNGGITPSSYTHKSNTAGNTIAISEGGNSCGFVQFMTEPYWCGGHCYSVIPYGVDNHFLYQALKGQQSAIMGLRVGSGLPNVQKTGLLAFKIHLPSTFPEQTAIASVLTEMDAELSALEHRRDKTHALKQGMMQELLTGRTRLV